MKRTNLRRCAALSLAVISYLSASSADAEMAFAPYKDELFAYPQPVAAQDGGRYLDVPYSEVRDIDRRDEVPERRVKRTYIDLSVVSRQADHTLTTDGGPLRYTTVGQATAGGPILVFVHGRNGDRRLGMNDWTFGGNFNRLKNLLARNDGLYVTVDAGRLQDEDAGRVADLVAELRRSHPGSKLVLACASMGGQICWTIATGDDATGIDAMVLLGSESNAEALARMRRQHPAPMPILVAHGTRDKVYAFDRQRALFDAVRREAPSYPIRFVAFDDGNHGTPIRMVDWRDTLNWIVERLP